MFLFLSVQPIDGIKVPIPVLLKNVQLLNQPLHRIRYFVDFFQKRDQRIGHQGNVWDVFFSYHIMKSHPLDHLHQLREYTTACIPINNKDWYKAVEFNVYGGDEIHFVKFTDEYERYLISRNDKERQNLVSEIKKKKGVRYNRVQLVSTFSFIRQGDCFHSATYRNKKQNIELAEYFQAVGALNIK